MNHFRGIYGIYLELITKNPKRSQHATGWTWKHSDFDQFCPKTSLDTGSANLWKMFDSTTHCSQSFGVLHAFTSRRSHKSRDCIFNISLRRWVFMRCGVGNRSTIVPLFSVGCVRVSTVSRLSTRVLSTKDLMPFMHTCMVILYMIQKYNIMCGLKKRKKRGEDEVIKHNSRYIYRFLPLATGF